MQVWEKINSLKGTNASKEQIANWAYSNRICPVEFADELELDCEYPSELTKISNKLCDNNTCGFECLTKFLESEVQEMNETELKSCPFKIGMTVYILGKYVPDPTTPILLLECKISHIKRRQFVAYRTDGETGEWLFSSKHYNKCVFTDKAKATEVLNRRVKNE